MSNITKSKIVGTVEQLIADNKSAILSAIPKQVNLERFARVAITTVVSDYKLAQCTPASIFKAILQASMIGLEPGGPLGEAYLVPFGNKATLMPGYKGFIKIAKSCGSIKNIYGEKVCENDLFEVKRGTAPRIDHHIDYFKARGNPVAFYAVYFDTDGNSDFEIMDMDDIESVRKRSKASNTGPWKTDFDEMAKIRPIRRLLKRVPMSIEMASVLEADDKTFNISNNAPSMVDEMFGDIIPPEPEKKPLAVDVEIPDNRKQIEEPAASKKKRTRKKKDTEKLELEAPPQPTNKEEKNIAILQEFEELVQDIGEKKVAAFLSRGNKTIAQVKKDFNWMDKCLKNQELFRTDCEDNFNPLPEGQEDDLPWPGAE